MHNRYALDVSYFNKCLGVLIRDIDNYKPDEMARALVRLANVADSEVLKEDEFSDHQAKIKEYQAHINKLTSSLWNMSNDMHHASKRPCPTCRPISELLNKPYGCYVFNGEFKSNSESNQ